MILSKHLEFNTLVLFFFCDRTVLNCRLHPNYERCSNCKSRNTIHYGKRTRTFKMLPVGNTKVEMSVSIPRLHCNDCGSIRQPDLPFADPKKHYVRALKRYVIDLCRLASIRDVAQITGLSWDTVKDIHKEYLQKKYKSINLKTVRRIAIDEKYLGKKRKFITIVFDLDMGRVIHVGNGKGKDALKGFWKRLKTSKAKIKAVATDMASGYIFAVMDNLPKAELVLDHFHLVKWFNEKLTRLRRQMFNEADLIGKKILKGSRWLLLKCPENLKIHSQQNKDERYRLQQALELNQPLATAYYMKERLRLLFECASENNARTELYNWIKEAESSGIRILKEAARQLRIWRRLILNWYKYPISTGKVEAANRKIGTLQRNAYGYRDEEYLMLRIYHLHKSNYSLTG
ncbi:ISL3 family transposase [Limihaloglobus sulfuriphilus]